MTSPGATVGATTCFGVSVGLPNDSPLPDRATYALFHEKATRHQYVTWRSSRMVGAERFCSFNAQLVAVTLALAIARLPIPPMRLIPRRCLGKGRRRHRPVKRAS